MFIDSAFNNSLERKAILIIQRKQPREYSISLLPGNLTEKKKKTKQKKKKKKKKKKLGLWSAGLMTFGKPSCKVYLNSACVVSDRSG